MIFMAYRPVRWGNTDGRRIPAFIDSSPCRVSENSAGVSAMFPVQKIPCSFPIRPIMASASRSISAHCLSLGLLVVSAVEPHQMQRCAIDDLSLFASFDAYDVRGTSQTAGEPDRTSPIRY